MQNAVASAKEAYKSWSRTTPLHRQKIMFKYRSIIENNLVRIIYLQGYFSMKTHSPFLIYLSFRIYLKCFSIPFFPRYETSMAWAICWMKLVESWIQFIPNVFVKCGDSTLPPPLLLLVFKIIFIMNLNSNFLSESE